MAEEHHPLTRLAYYTVGTLFASFGGFIAISLITAPVWALIAIGGGIEFLGYAVLSLLGWCLFMGQKMVFGKLENELEASDHSWIVSTVLSIASVFYYNVVLVIVMVVATALGSSGFLVPAVGFAFLYPIYEMRTMDQGSLFSIAGIFGLAVATILVTGRLAHGVTRKNVHFDELPLRFFAGRRLN